VRRDEVRPRACASQVLGRRRGLRSEVLRPPARSWLTTWDSFAASRLTSCENAARWSH